MADPFEVRMRFTNQLVHLNASTASAMKAASYAIKYAEFGDDLFSCILEQLERTNMNLRANIMYFIPALCDLSRSQGEVAYARMVERDISRIVELVAPSDGSGAANVKVVRRVLQQLQQKQLLEPATVAELDGYIASRDTAPTSPEHGNGNAELDVSGMPSYARYTPQSAVRDPGTYSAIRLDKRQIEQRIEEDRERHKRAREGIWAIQQKPGSLLTEDVEFEKLWAELLDVAEDDRLTSREEKDERSRCVQFEAA